TGDGYGLLGRLKNFMPLETVQDEHGPITPPQPELSPLEQWQISRASRGFDSESTANWLVGEREKEANRSRISDDQYTSGCCAGRQAMVYVAKRLIGRPK